MAINHVAGAIGRGMVEGKCEGIGFGTEFVCCFQHWPSEFSCGPDLEICHLAEEVLAVSCVVNIPDLLLNLGIERLAAFLGAVSDLEKGMEEARFRVSRP